MISEVSFLILLNVSTSASIKKDYKHQFLSEKKKNWMKCSNRKTNLY